MRSQTKGAIQPECLHLMRKRLSFRPTCPLSCLQHSSPAEARVQLLRLTQTTCAPHTPVVLVMCLADSAPFAPNSTAAAWVAEQMGSHTACESLAAVQRASRASRASPQTPGLPQIRHLLQYPSLPTRPRIPSASGHQVLECFISSATATPPYTDSALRMPDPATVCWSVCGPVTRSKWFAV